MSIAGTTVEGVTVERLDVSAYTIPTDEPESDGTAEWRETTMVIVEANAGGRTGLGYTYADAAAARLVSGVLAPAVEGLEAFAVAAASQRMSAAVRNMGRPGLAAAAIAAVDSALWDLSARILEVPLAHLLGAASAAVPVYGSGGFTSYKDDRLVSQLAGWVDDGIPRVKMKVGRNPQRDRERVRQAREAIGNDTELYVDANGALTRKQALRSAEDYAELGVSWFEEPVSSDDLEGLRLLRDRGPSGMDIAAGEYGYTLFDFRRLLDAGAVDCLQADMTRCQGISGFLRVAALCEAHGLELSAHCAPALHAHPCCAVVPFRHLEWFHDHVRIEERFFDGFLEPVGGCLRPDLSRPGNGLELKRADIAHFAVRGGSA